MAEETAPAPLTQTPSTDSSLSQTPPPAPATPAPVSPKPNKMLKNTGLAVALLVLIGGAVFFYMQQHKVAPGALSSSQIAQLKSQGIIAKVGEEYIYQKDLDHEMSYNPNASDPAKLKTTLLNKLVTDSITIQGGLADKMASVDATVFNSPTKDYAKRTKLVAQIMTQVTKSDINYIAGTLVSIWFDNGRLSTAGDDQRKKIALQKITVLHNNVKNQKMTIAQAIDAIKNDASLASLDPSYKSNAGTTFNSYGQTQISFDPDFDKAIKSLPNNGLSDIYLLKDHQTMNPPSQVGPLIDAAYSFAMVTGKKTDGIMNFDDWLSQKKNIYEITYF